MEIAIEREKGRDGTHMVRVSHLGKGFWSRPGKVGREGAVEHLRRIFSDYSERKAEWRKRIGELGLRELAKMEGVR